MNESVHKMSLLVGELMGGLDAVKQTVENLNRVWGQREQAATEGRLVIQAKLESVRNDMTRLEAGFDNVVKDLKIIKPAMDAFKTESERQEGEKRLSKKIGAALVALSAIVGGAAGEALHRYFH